MAGEVAEQRLDAPLHEFPSALSRQAARSSDGDSMTDGGSEQPEQGQAPVVQASPRKLQE